MKDYRIKIEIEVCNCEEEAEAVIEVLQILSDLKSNHESVIANRNGRKVNGFIAINEIG